MKNKELIRANKNTQMKYERFEKEREAKMLIKNEVKILRKELGDISMEK